MSSFTIVDARAIFSKSPPRLRNLSAASRARPIVVPASGGSAGPYRCRNITHAVDLRMMSAVGPGAQAGGFRRRYHATRPPTKRTHKAEAFTTVLREQMQQALFNSS